MNSGDRRDACPGLLRAVAYQILQSHTMVGRLASPAPAVARVLPPGEQPCLVLASAGACGWSVCDSKSSQALLDAFEFCWGRWTRPLCPQRRLRCAVQGAVRRHHRPLKGQVPEDVDVLGFPWVSLAAVHLQQNTAYCVWVGGEEIFCHSGSGIVWSNHPPSQRSLRGFAGPDTGTQLHNAEVHLAPGMRLTLANWQWPRRRPLEELHGLLEASQRQRTQWCKQHQREYLSLLSCRVD